MTQVIRKADWLTANRCLAQAWFAMRATPTPPSEADLFLMEQGQEVGRRARELYPNGVMVSTTNGQLPEEITRRLVAEPSVDTLFEAEFRDGSVVARADILKRLDGAWHVLEVKASFSDTGGIEALIEDLAYTVMVVRRAGLQVSRASLVLLSREYRHGEAVDRLFQIVDETDEVDERASEDADSVTRVGNALLGDVPPKAVLVSGCRDCDFFANRCLGAGLAHTVLELPGLNHKKLKRLSDAGVIDLSRVPKSVELNERQERVRYAALSGNTVVEPSLAGAIRSVEWPCRYLDFETVTTFLPLYPGHGCHQQVLTQFSVHCRESPDAGLSHVDFLAEARRDCQRELAETLIQSLGDRGSIVVYSTFEATRISALRDAFPELAEGLQLILGRLVDLLPLIRDHVYHPSFGGSFSIKRVLPALVADLSYAELEVADGYTAVARFARMARGEIYGEEATRVRQHLLDYCERDTLAMVRLHDALSRLAAGRRAAGV